MINQKYVVFVLILIIRKKISENNNNLEFLNLIDYLQYILINGFKRMVKPLHELKTDINEYPYIYNLDMDNELLLPVLLTFLVIKIKDKNCLKLDKNILMNYSSNISTNCSKLSLDIFASKSIVSLFLYIFIVG